MNSNARSADLGSSSRDVRLGQKQDMCSRVKFILGQACLAWDSASLAKPPGGTGAREHKSAAGIKMQSLVHLVAQPVWKNNNCKGQVDGVSTHIQKRCLMPSVLLSEDVLVLIVKCQDGPDRNTAAR